jgi:hypothetical protein
MVLGAPRTNACKVPFSTFLAAEDDVLVTIPAMEIVTRQAPEQREAPSRLPIVISARSSSPMSEGSNAMR